MLTERPQQTNDRADTLLRRVYSRRHIALLLSVPVAALGGTGSAQAYHGAPVEDRYADTALLHTLINAVRQGHGLAPLDRRVELDQASQAHALDMAQHDFVSHIGSDGADAITRIKRFYPRETLLGETIGAGYTDAAALVDGWMASERHRAILLDPGYRTLGLACMLGWQTTYQWHWTADFGG